MDADSESDVPSNHGGVPAQSLLQSTRLEQEVSSLSTKLLEAMGNSAELGQEVKLLRKELETCRAEKSVLETQIKNGFYVKRSDMDSERSLRVEAEAFAAKARGETIELTEKLFEEANTMVSVARHETADVQKKNEALITQLSEKDLLLETMQQQLAELKNVLLQMSEKKDSRRLSRPKLGKQLSVNRLYSNISIDPPQSSPTAASGSGSLATVSKPGSHAPLTQRNVEQLNEDVLFPTVRPMVRYDLVSFDEFKQILYSSQHSYLEAAYASPYTPTASTFTSPTLPSSAVFERSTSSPSSSGGDSAPTTTATTTSTTSAALSNRFHFFSNSLKDYKFFKKALADDIEPTLRLEHAPGFSWLARRTVMSSIMDGTVIIEPIASVNERSLSSQTAVAGDNSAPTSVTSSAAPEVRPVATLSPCAFCGESRNDLLLHARMHNLRVPGKEAKDTESASNGSSAHGGHIGGGQVGIRAAAASLLASSSTHNGTHNSAHGSTHNGTHNSGNVNGTTGGAGANSSDASASSSSSALGNNSNTSVPISMGYPMCHYCLTRVRAVCDFIGFIRSIRDGVWKVENPQQEARAWRECIRLRERMFYARVGARFSAYGEDEGYEEDTNEVDEHEAGWGAFRKGLEEQEQGHEHGYEKENENDNKAEPAIENQGVAERNPELLHRFAKANVNDEEEMVGSDNLPKVETITISDDDTSAGQIDGQIDGQFDEGATVKNEVDDASNKVSGQFSPDAIPESHSGDSEDEFLDTYADNDGDIVEDVEIVEVQRATHRQVS